MMVCVVRGDITKLATDAIVTAANDRLTGCSLPGHCVDAAVFAAAGPRLFEACRALGGCPTGEAKITPGFNLPSNYVIHTVSPIWKKESEIPLYLEQLASCYEKSLTLAHEHNLTSVAFCCIGTGLFGVPKHVGAKVALDTTKKWLKSHKSSTLKKVIFCTFTDIDERLYKITMTKSAEIERGQ
jgi:O-acetyl-ADP-ribose deacetylase (regulator of RNase III)